MVLWLDPKPVEVPPALGQAVGGHPLVAETLARRGILTPDAAQAFLDPALYTPAEPSDLPGMATAVSRIWQAIEKQERIAIWGDFDADGITSTAVLVDTLRALDADVVSRVPLRDEGHGVHEKGLDELIEIGARLIVTCDTGVTAFEAVAHANQRGAEVIITDHHVLSKRLPDALAVINPHRLPPAHPLGTLAGVGVAYQLAKALDPEIAARTLDLVATGTVADVATLTGDNRYLVQRGIEALRHTKRLGLLAIYETAKLDPKGLTEEHIGFVLGPRLNALGRLSDANRGVEMLTTADPTHAHAWASEAEGLNAQRRWLTKQVTAGALSQIKREPALAADYQALVLSHHSWEGGVVGIAAGRLAERFGKPSILITAPEGKLARGSGRSVPGINLVAALDECAHLLLRYGGHAGAAGFVLDAERIPEFRAALSRAVTNQVVTIPEPTLSIDAYVELPELTLELVADLNCLAPFGPGNPPLTLAVRNVRASSQATIGRTSEHRRITIEDEQGRTQTVFWWHGADWPLPRDRFDLALSIRASDYRGMSQIQIQWLDARPLEPDAVEIQPAPTIAVRDLRKVEDPEATLRALFAEGEVQVWAEVDTPLGAESHTRQALEPCNRLALWTSPPGPRELQSALDVAQPQEIILFARNPGMDDPGQFQKRLAGLVKFALRSKDGEVDLQSAAAATAQTVSTVKAGMELLAAQGKVGIIVKEEGLWHLSADSGLRSPADVEAIRTRLNALLAEAGAYRDYLAKAPPEAVAP